MAVHRSAPLRSIVRDMNHASDNLVAELLLRQLGVDGPADVRTAGLRRVQHVLREALPGTETQAMGPNASSILKREPVYKGMQNSDPG